MVGGQLMKSKLWIIGTPLSDREPLASTFSEKISRLGLFIGESRGRAQFLLRHLPADPTREVHLLDPPHPHQRQALFEALDKAANAGTDIGLFSDTGMPISFDPGLEVLQWARQRNLEIRSLPAATSWGSAAALSGYLPPYYVWGFPPRESKERDTFFAALKQKPEAGVILETPYRFHKVLQELEEKVGGDREVFVAWELSSEQERLLWFPLRDWKRQTAQYGLEKGEFVIVLGPRPKAAPEKRGARR